MESNHDFSTIIVSLQEVDQMIVSGLHETAAALGYEAKISAVGTKPDHWRCEYLKAKPKQTLYILRIAGQKFTIRAKLFHLAEYTDVLENCSDRFKASLLSSSKNCGNHARGCGGPVSFSISGTSYSKCRHYFVFAGITPADVNCIRQLFISEAQYSQTF